MKEKINYEVGALLYSPALNNKIFEMIAEERIKEKYSLCLCLEDAISDNAVAEGEKEIINTFKKLKNYKSISSKEIFFPKIFIRVRNPEQVIKIFSQIKDCDEFLSGFVFPKYSLHCADKYNEAVLKVNEISKKKIYMMPILESSDIIDLNTRYNTLYSIKEKTDKIKDLVLNIRVGGNDFCKEFGIRRSQKQNIYDITPVKNILSDILTVFSREYIVSGPVWEYFAGKDESWKEGMKKEVELDMLNGFIGKTVIHPNQIEIVNNCLMPSKTDYEDAAAIINWKNNFLGVNKSSAGERMNEVKVHLKWAEKIIMLKEIYGVK